MFVIIYTGIKKSNDSYSCECPIGFLGERCDRRRSCYSDCHPEYSHCVKRSHNMQLCACLPNPNGLYNKSYCDPIYDCKYPGLCLNGGTCINSGGGYYCHCSDDFEGLICQKKVYLLLLLTNI